MHDILKHKAWAVSDEYFNRMYPIISDRLRLGHSLDTLIHKKEASEFLSKVGALLAIDPDTDTIAVTYNPWTGKEVLPVVKSGSKNIALIPIEGALSKVGFCGAHGMQDYGRFISQANANPDIHGIVLIIDSPGGTVDGTIELANIVKNSAKPVGVFGDSLVASAALWIASQASVIVGNKNNLTEFGSIGVLRVHEDWSNVIENGRHPKVEVVTAPQSTEKVNVTPFGPLSDDQRTTLKEHMRPIAAQFMSEVKAGRGEKLKSDTEGLFKGRMFNLTESKAAGLIDHIGTLQTAITKVAEMARSTGNTGTPVSGNSNKGLNANNNMKFPKLSAILGEAWNSVIGAFTDDAKPLEAAEQKVADMEANLVKATGEKSAAEQRATAAEAKVTELTAQVSTLTSEKTTLEGSNTKLESEKKELTEKLAAAPAGASTTVIEADPKKDFTPTSVDAEKKKYL